MFCSLLIFCTYSLLMRCHTAWKEVFICGLSSDKSMWQVTLLMKLTITPPRPDERLWKSNLCVWLHGKESILRSPELHNFKKTQSDLNCAVGLFPSLTQSGTFTSLPHPLTGSSPVGTSFQVVMSLGFDRLRTGPTSDAQVSPVLHASAPSRERHIQEAEYCLLKSMGISPGPTWSTSRKWITLLTLHSHREAYFLCFSVYLDHVEQRQLSGNTSIAENLNPIPLTS